MNLDSKTTRRLDFFASQMTTVSKEGWVGVVILILFLIGGLYALVVQIIEGHIVTGMRDNVVWGLYIQLYLFYWD